MIEIKLTFSIFQIKLKVSISSIKSEVSSLEMNNHPRNSCDVQSKTKSTDTNINSKHNTSQHTPDNEEHTQLRTISIPYHSGHDTKCHCEKNITGVSANMMAYHDQSVNTVSENHHAEQREQRYPSRLCCTGLGTLHRYPGILSDNGARIEQRYPMRLRVSGIPFSKHKLLSDHILNNLLKNSVIPQYLRTVEPTRVSGSISIPGILNQCSQNPHPSITTTINNCLSVQYNIVSQYCPCQYKISEQPDIVTSFTLDV